MQLGQHPCSWSYHHQVHVLHYLHVLLTSEVDVLGGIVTTVGPLPRPPLADQPAVLHPSPAPCIHLEKRNTE